MPGPLKYPLWIKGREPSRKILFQLSAKTNMTDLTTRSNFSYLARFSTISVLTAFQSPLSAVSYTQYISRAHPLVFTKSTRQMGEVQSFPLLCSNIGGKVLERQVRGIKVFL